MFKYYYAFMGRPMRNRAGMNTSVVFGFTKFLRDIQKREHPDLLGVAFDPKGGSFRRAIYPEYKANRAETPEDILLSVPYVKRVLDAMCIPVLEVAGYEADDVIGTLAARLRGAAAGYEVYMVTPDKDYGQLVDDRCRIYKAEGRRHRGGGPCGHRGQVRHCRSRARARHPRAVGRRVGQHSGRARHRREGRVQTGAGVGHGGKHPRPCGRHRRQDGRADRRLGRKLLLAKRLTTICLDVPIPFREEDLTVCAPRIDELKALFAELDFRIFMGDPANAAPAEQPAEGPRQAAQTQLAEVARAKSAAAKKAALAGQGDLFAALAAPDPAPGDRGGSGGRVGAFGAADRHGGDRAARLRAGGVGRAAARRGGRGGPLRGVLLRHRDHRIRRIQRPHRGAVAGRGALPGVVRAFRARKRGGVRRDPRAAVRRRAHRAKIGQNVKFDLMVLRRIGIEVAGRLYDTMILHYLLDPEGRHNMNALALRYLDYRPIEIETLIGRGARQLTMDLVAIDRVKGVCRRGRRRHAAAQAGAVAPCGGETGMEALYVAIEEPMIRVLADIETAGVRIDSEALAAYAVELGGRMAELEAEIRLLADEPALNVNSSRQLGELLFAKMRIDEKPKMTRTKQFCTDEEYLQGFCPQSTASWG